MGHDATAAIQGLSDLLARQKDAVRRGELAALPSLAEQLAEHLDALVQHPVQIGRASMDRLKGQTEENQRLLGAALRGVRAAAGRLHEIAGVAREFKTYDSHGQSASVSIASGTMERRA